MNSNKKPKSYESALKKAWNDLTELEPMEVANKSGASYNPEKDEFSLTLMNGDYHIRRSLKNIKNPEGQDAKPFIAVLLLHYLIYAKDIESEDNLITFRELVGGDVYYDAFQRRAILPVTNTFGSNAKILRESGKSLGAKESNYGDVSVEVEVFPKITVTVILWEGDEEIPPSSNMLFDASIKELLPTEDVAVIGGFVASALIKNIPKSQ